MFLLNFTLENLVMTDGNIKKESREFNLSTYLDNVRGFFFGGERETTA